MKFVFLAFILSGFASAQVVNLKTCKTELHRFCAIACAGGGLVPKYCSGSMKRLGPLVVDLSFDPATGIGSGSGTLHTVGMNLTEDFKLSCAPSKSKKGFLDCVTDIGMLGVSNKNLVLHTRAQALKDGSYYFWVGAPGEYKWLGAFQTSKACLP